MVYGGPSIMGWRQSSDVKARNKQETAQDVQLDVWRPLDHGMLTSVRQVALRPRLLTGLPFSSQFGWIDLNPRPEQQRNRFKWSIALLGGSLRSQTILYNC